MKTLSRSFFLRPTLQVARALLGKLIVRKLRTNLLIGKIVEVEAYCKRDPASHAFRGRTRRNDVMFWEGGHLYVYFTYGMYFCANVVTGKEGIGEAVLIRAVEPLAGIEVMKVNRYGSDKLLINLTNGPAKFCQAFNISKKENGLDLLNSEVIIIDGESISAKHIKRSSRIGIKEETKKKWRFFIDGNPWVSKRKSPA